MDRLQVGWIYRSDEMRENPATTIQCNPIVIDGVLYVTTPTFKVVALAAATGLEKWRLNPYEGDSASGGKRGGAYWSNDAKQRIFYVAGSYLYSLDAGTGKVLQSFGQAGRCLLLLSFARSNGREIEVIGKPARETHLLKHIAGYRLQSFPLPELIIFNYLKHPMRTK